MTNHSIPDKAIVIVGRICSGKSFLAKQISEMYNIPITSFGGYLREYCLSNSLPVDRRSLQDIGERFIKEEPELFLSNVLKRYAGSGRVVVEGVRHKIVFQLIKKLCPQSISIFLDVGYEIRYQRFLLRNKDSDSDLKSETEFQKVNEHPVELEVGYLMNECDFRVSQFGEELDQQITQFLDCRD